MNLETKIIKALDLAAKPLSQKEIAKSISDNRDVFIAIKTLIFAKVLVESGKDKVKLSATGHRYAFNGRSVELDNNGITALVKNLFVVRKKEEIEDI
jgi:hypothetical protein